MKKSRKKFHHTIKNHHKGSHEYFIGGIIGYLFLSMIVAFYFLLIRFA